MFRAGTQDNDVHLAIVRGSRNRWLADALCRDLYALLRVQRARSAALGDRASRAHAEHRGILDAIRRRDPDEAEARMRAHIRAARANLDRADRGTLGPHAD